MTQFKVGIIAIAVLMGFLVGASDSPVAGVAITAAFGMITAALALFQQSIVAGSKREGSHSDCGNDPPEPEPDINDFLGSLGGVFLVFSIAFAAGLCGGIASRIAFAGPHQQVKLPWDGLDPPRSAKKAVDWTIARKRLLEMGYSDEQVVLIYKLDLESRKKSSVKEALLESENDLLSPLFANVASSKSAGTREGFPVIAWDPRIKSNVQTY